MANSLIPTNEVKNVSAQCRIIVYKWKDEDLFTKEKSPAQLSDSIPLDISCKIQHFSYSKSLDSPAGDFSFTVANNVGYGEYNDWKQFIKPGTWCTIYLSQEGDLNYSNNIEIVKDKNNPPLSKLRCVGYIERCAVKTELNANGAFDATFEFSGRDYGVIYEDTILWFNTFFWDLIRKTAFVNAYLPVIATVTLDVFLKKLHSLFLAPQKLIELAAALGIKNNPTRSLTGQMRQWLLPSQLIKDLDMKIEGNASYYGAIIDDELLKFTPTTATLAINNPLDYINGQLWQAIKSLSIPQYHELFPELSDSGKLQLIFRPIPFAIDTTKYPKAEAAVTNAVIDKTTGEKGIFKFVKLPRILVEPIDVLDFHIGKDDHTRHNQFVTIITNCIQNVETNAAWLALQKTDADGNKRYPIEIKNSITRHGFRQMMTQINSLYQSAAPLKNGKPQLDLDGAMWVEKVIEYNEILFDYWGRLIYLDSGTLNKIGSNDVKLGKVLQFSETVPYVAKKLFYIERYVDDFDVDEKGAGSWTQSLELTRGGDEQSYINGSDVESSDFSGRYEPYQQEGDYTPDKEDK